MKTNNLPVKIERFDKSDNNFITGYELKFNEEDGYKSFYYRDNFIHIGYPHYDDYMNKKYTHYMIEINKNKNAKEILMGLIGLKIYTRFIQPVEIIKKHKSHYIIFTGYNIKESLISYLIQREEEERINLTKRRKKTLVRYVLNLNRNKKIKYHCSDKKYSVPILHSKKYKNIVLYDKILDKEVKKDINITKNKTYIDNIIYKRKVIRARKYSVLFSSDKDSFYTETCIYDGVLKMLQELFKNISSDNQSDWNEYITKYTKNMLDRDLSVDMYISEQRVLKRKQELLGRLKNENIKI